MPPEDIRSLLRLDLVETESGPVDIHIGNQRYPIFLLDQTGSQAASFFAASTEAEYLLRIQQALKTKTDRARSKRKELLQECTDLETGLERYLPLTELEIELSVAEARHARLVALQEALPRLQRTLKVLEETGLLYSGKENASTLLKELALPPQIAETKGLELTLRDLAGVLSQSEVVAARTAALTPLSGPPSPADTTHLDTLIKAWEGDQTALNGRRLAAEALEILEAPPALHEVKKVEELVQNLERTQQRHNQSIAARSALETMVAPPEPPLAAPLQTLIEQLRAAARSFELCSVREGALEALPDPPELHAIRPLEELTSSMGDVQGRLQNTHRFGGILAQLASSPELQAVAAGDDLLGRMMVLWGQLEANARLLDEVASAIDAKRQAIEQKIQDLGLCPLCGHPLDMDHFLEASHG
jgi:exonuclease SbcC